MPILIEKQFENDDSENDDEGTFGTENDFGDDGTTDKSGVVITAALAAVATSAAVIYGIKEVNRQHAEVEFMNQSLDIVNNLFLAHYMSGTELTDENVPESKEDAEIPYLTMQPSLPYSFYKNIMEGKVPQEAVESKFSDSENVCSPTFLASVMKAIHKNYDNAKKSNFAGTGVFGTLGTRPKASGILPFPYRNCETDTEKRNYNLSIGFGWNKTKPFQNGFNRSILLNRDLYDEISKEMSKIEIDGTSQTPEEVGVEGYKDFLNDNGFKLFHAYFRLMKLLNIERDEDVKIIVGKQRRIIKQEPKSNIFTSSTSILSKSVKSLFNWILGSQSKNNTDEEKKNNEDSDSS
tara:strand:+ start:244 stop:1293 length:1050 start_codon:yes stop_codon:yes gene_type:complete